MSKFCTRCGAVMYDKQVRCPQCGAIAQDYMYGANPVSYGNPYNGYGQPYNMGQYGNQNFYGGQQYNNAQPYNNFNPYQPYNNNKVRFAYTPEIKESTATPQKTASVILSMVLTLVFFASFFGFIFFTTSYKTPAKELKKVLLNGDANAYCRLIPEPVDTCLRQTASSDSTEKMYSQQAEELKNQFIQKIGKDKRVTYTLGEKLPLSEQNIELYKQDIIDNCVPGTSVDITEAYSIKQEFTVTDTYDLKKNISVELVVADVNGKWCLLNYDDIEIY